MSQLPALRHTVNESCDSSNPIVGITQIVTNSSARALPEYADIYKRELFGVLADVLRRRFAVSVAVDDFIADAQRYRLELVVMTPEKYRAALRAEYERGLTDGVNTVLPQ